MMKYAHLYSLLLMFIFCYSSKGQTRTDLPVRNTKPETKDVVTSYGPNTMVRNIKLDRKGNIWIAASNGGVFRYDGKSFTNITSKVISARFWNVLEDRHGNLWFASTDSGVYFYHGKSFRNFTTKVGLSNNDVTTIIEDKTGKFWFDTRGNACSYDGKTFTIFKNKDGKTFNNVWSIIEDKKGNIWTSSQTSNGWALSRYDEKSLTNEKPTVAEIRSEDEVTRRMIFGISEASDGSIWFGALNGVHRYDGNTITDFKDKEVQK
ncbi:two-component regulator propeller domain-containing protein [Flavitalea sp. BT771]|uniref:ligand-binding sensor domain-containing protein n=1 Tax=Flavitalea sp. BT771 TaxID=3063329 RepID=UPI0026E3DC11|nr:two-component regulator propeller domain-containing protein [Flavitalea sp. BT771]MDO6431516.1 two-component regulator propeller domain-containing protein [Flavitalea sp. BT771]MDV6220424.1 two-component regulator propeller domain-containing protein [Flavitalea sp. BT771]